MNRLALKARLIRDEGLRLKPYKDTVGKLTIGVGRNLDDRGISVDEARILLDHDIDDHENELRAKWPHYDKLDDVRQEVLLNMAFNLGVPGLLKFVNTLAAVVAGDFDAAAYGMLHSKWASQVGKRASRLAEEMRTGIRLPV